MENSIFKDQLSYDMFISNDMRWLKNLFLMMVKVHNWYCFKFHRRYGVTGKLMDGSHGCRDAREQQNHSANWEIGWAFKSLLLAFSINSFIVLLTWDAIPSCVVWSCDIRNLYVKRKWIIQSLISLGMLIWWLMCWLKLQLTGLILQLLLLLFLV